MRPTALLVPLVGFDRLGFRLGYGGGYYDRTLAAMDPKPLTIGFGYELGRLETIYPQPHDIPMDAVVTEAGLVKSPPWRADAALVQPFPGLFGETFAVGLAVVEDGDAPGVPALGEKIARDLA